MLVAVSGGVDSTVLLYVLCELAPRFELALAVAHVDHGLRGDESAADARFVAGLARELGLSADVEAVDLQPVREGVSSRLRPSPQEAARRLRYRALREVADLLLAARGARDALLDELVGKERAR